MTVIDLLTAANEGLLLSPGAGWVTSAPNIITHSFGKKTELQNNSTLKIQRKKKNLHVI